MTLQQNDTPHCTPRRPAAAVTPPRGANLLKSCHLSGSTHMCVGAGNLYSMTGCLIQVPSSCDFKTMSGISKKQAKKSLEGTGLGACARHLWLFRQPHVSHCLSGKLTGKPRGGEAGRQILRLWQTEAMAMPGFPMNFSKSDRAILMASCISRYAAIGETVTEKQANDAVKNMKNTFLKKNKVHRDELPFCMHCV